MFVSKEKTKVHAHLIMLINASSFFKNVFGNYELDPYPKTIVLPNFSTETIQAFIQFLYTGEILINQVWIEEFISLCHEFKCDEIQVISELMKKHKTVASDSQEDPAVQEKSKENLIITRLMEVSKEEIEFDEYFDETNDNVETIFFNENECNEGEFIDRPSSSSNTKPIEEKEIKEEYLNVQFIEDNPHVVEDMIDDSQKLKDQEDSEYDQMQEELSMENLEMAVDEVKSGMSTWNAHKKYGVPRDLILKRLDGSPDHQQSRKAIKKNLLAPSITFPALAMNLTQLREEQNRFKKRLQEAINSCRDSGNSVKKASKIFGVPVQAIERNLRGFKNLSTD